MHVVDLSAVTKQFRHRTEIKGGYKTLKSIFLGNSKNFASAIAPAVNNITLRVPKGLSFGIIGRNGSGKSTLLKIITGIYKPTTGTVNVKGRVAALIELGAGFHPDFTGRENIFLGGAVYGLSREQIKQRFNQIVEFAELAEVIDEPVRTYSSGMFMRLGFSVAVHTEPDILIVDEVLSVGDASFVTKCEDKIAQLKQQGTTLIVVSHDLSAIERWCDEVLWIDKGHEKDRGSPRRVIDHYREFIEKGEEQALSQTQQISERVESSRWGSREVEISDVRILDNAGSAKHVFHPHDQLIVEFDYLVREPRKDIVFGVGICRSDGLSVHGTNTDIDQIVIEEVKKNGTVRYKMDSLLLVEGSYSVDIAAHTKEGYPFDYHKAVKQFSVRSPLQHVGVFNPPHEWDLSKVQ